MKGNLAGNLLALAAAGMLCHAQEAAATVITQTGSFSDTTDFTHPFTFNRFDSSLGILNSVYLSLSGGLSSSGSVKNNASGSETFTLSLSSLFRLTFPNPPASVSANTPSVSQTYNNLASGASATFGPVSTTLALSKTFTASTDLDFYQAFGGGALNGIGFSTLTSQCFTGGGGNVSAQLATLASADVLLQYNYTPVPEATTSLAGALLLLPVSWVILGPRLRKRVVGR